MEPDNINKIFCTKCFQPIVAADDNIQIEGRHFHKNCSTCSLCHITPTSLQMFYGQVFCNDCFKNFPGFFREGHGNQYPGWWLHWNPYMQSSCSRCNNCGTNSIVEENNKNNGSNSSSINLLCFRCHKVIDENCKVLIEGNFYHDQCAKCCMCNLVPTSMKLYYGYVFCDVCLHQHVLKHQGPSPFFQSCFEQWRGNPQFGDFMNRFMTSGSNNQQVYVMHHGPPPFWGCRSSHQWNSSGRGKSATTTDSQAYPETDSSFITINQNEKTQLLINRGEINDNYDNISNVTFTEHDESINGNISNNNEPIVASVSEHDESVVDHNESVVDHNESVVDNNESISENVIEHDQTLNNRICSDSTITEQKTESLLHIVEDNKNENIVENATSNFLEKIEKLSRIMRVPGKVSCNKKWNIFVKKEELKSM